MIYVCEYDGSADWEKLRVRAEELPIALPGRPLEGWLLEKQRQRILAWLLLEKAVKQEWGHSLKELAVCREKHGKPYSSAYPELHFNLSHCGAACACVTGSAEAGIDVEEKFPYRSSLERKICHEEEQRILKPLTSEARTRQLRYLWSMKESFVKLDGRGLGYGMDRVNLASALPVCAAPEGEYCVRGAAGHEGQNAASGGGETLWFRIHDAETYTLSVCGPRPEGQICYVREGELTE